MNQRVRSRGAEEYGIEPADDERSQEPLEMLADFRDPEKNPKNSLDGLLRDMSEHPTGMAATYVGHLKENPADRASAGDGRAERAALFARDSHDSAVEQAFENYPGEMPADWEQRAGDANLKYRPIAELGEQLMTYAMVHREPETIGQGMNFSKQAAELILQYTAGNEQECEMLEVLEDYTKYTGPVTTEDVNMLAKQRVRQVEDFRETFSPEDEALGDQMAIFVQRELAVHDAQISFEAGKQEVEYLLREGDPNLKEALVDVLSHGIQDMQSPSFAVARMGMTLGYEELVNTAYQEVRDAITGVAAAAGVNRDTGFPNPTPEDDIYDAVTEAQEWLNRLETMREPLGQGWLMEHLHREAVNNLEEVTTKARMTGTDEHRRGLIYAALREQHETANV